MFLESWNGLSLLQCTITQTPTAPEFFIQTDASGSWGCGPLFEGRWLQLQWSPQWSEVHIMAKEILPIVLSCAVWSPILARRKVLFQCDNSSVVAALQKGSAKGNVVMHLLRCLWFFVAHYDIMLVAEHIAGADNSTADHLSRNKMHAFFSINS